MSTVSPKAISAASRRSLTSPTPLSKSPTMRTAGTARASPPVPAPAVRRRPPAKVAPVPQLNGETRESLSASLKQETDQKEQLLVQLQDKEQTIATLATENNNVTSALNAAETRLNDLYAEQSRWEMELAQRIDIAEKLREQVRELEKEKRDVQRRYNEQTATFDAERQAFYDNEQHLKSRIQSLSQARKRVETAKAEASVNEGALSLAEEICETEEPAPAQEPSLGSKATMPQPDYNDPENEPAEMTALKLELSTLSTSYSSLQSTLILLQSQLVDLKRVNQGLQEENESYMILLREKTLSGQFDLMRQVGGGSSSDDGDTEDDEPEGNGDGRSLHSLGRSTLDRVEEEPEGLAINIPQGSNIANLEVDVPSSTRSSRHPSRQGRKRTISGSAPRGESLADLPITGPGLDLAAELGRAENKDILEGNYIEESDRDLGKGKRSKKGVDGRRASGTEDGNSADIEALRTEVKSLKDANKALSLYASKIIDRIIAQEGFEHVLAADYEKEPNVPSTPGPNAARAPPQASPAKQRPQSVIISRAASNPVPASPQVAPPPPKAPKAQRRSLSFDWKTFSFSAEKKPEPSLRPLTLKPGASPIVTGGRKLDTEEDDEDRKERERLNATMKLMGIQPQPSIHTSVITRTGELRSNSPSSGLNRRASLWGGSKSTADNSDAASIHSTHSMDPYNSSRHGLGLGSGLTHEALEHAEAENSLAALDAREKNLREEIAKGASGGFTEIAPRSIGRRSRRSAGGSGSGSTVWSAGMSEGHE